MGAFRDLTDQKFNQLTVKTKTRYVKGKGWYWNCVCDCGTKKELLGTAVSHSHIRSCGCLLVEARKTARLTHGETGSSAYCSWQGAKKRCYDKKDKQYKDYGGRGIRVCDEWLNSFETFSEDMGPMPTGYTIERNDVNGHYTKENCRWIPKGDQNLNKRNSSKFPYKGKLTNVTVIAREVGLSPGALAYRLEQNGGNVEAAITLPSSTPIRKTTIPYRGEERKTKELEAIAGVPRKIIRERMREEWSPEDAVETPYNQPAEKIEVKWEGQKYPSLKSLSKHLNLSYSLVYQRMKRLKLSPHEAITSALSDKR